MRKGRNIFRELLARSRADKNSPYHHIPYQYLDELKTIEYYRLYG